MAEERAPRRFNNRPESTIAQNFAADLDSMFGLSSDPAVEDLSQKVEAKKQYLTTEQRQLQELEAKLRETEERLARVSRQNSPSRQPESKQTPDGAAKPSPLAQKPTYPDSRPATGERAPNKQQHHNGSSEYVMVAQENGNATAERGYG